MRMMPGYDSEADEQRTLMSWAELESKQRHPELALLFHIPNGGSRDPREAHNLRMQGVKPGVPDLCLPVARGAYHAMYIEMKRRKGGRVSEDQRAWLDALTRAGCFAVVCYGWEDAADRIERYLKGEPK